MLSLFSAVGLALFTQAITSLPALPSSDDAGLSEDLGLDLNQLSSVGTDAEPSFSSLDPPPSEKSEAPLSLQLALNINSSASAPPTASQDDVNPEYDKSSKGKKETRGVETSCSADFTNSSPRHRSTGPQNDSRRVKNTVPNGQVNTTPK